MSRETPKCGEIHRESGAACELPQGHVQNHSGPFAHGHAQWPQKRIHPDDILSPREMLAFERGRQSGALQSQSEAVSRALAEVREQIAQMPLSRVGGAGVGNEAEVRLADVLVILDAALRAQPSAK